MTVIKVIYSPKLATFFSRWHMRLIPFAEFERSGDGRVNNSYKPIQSKASIIVNS